MAEEMLPIRPESGKTFNTAMWVVGVLAAVQVFAAGWAVLTRTPKPAAVYQVAAVPQLPVQQEPVINETVEPKVPAPFVPPADEEIIPLQTNTGESEMLNTETAEEPESTVRASLGLQEAPPDSVLPEPTLYGLSSSAEVPKDGSLADALMSAAATVEPIADPLIDRLIATGREHRSSGDSLKALQAFRDAQSAVPNHPTILAEFAATYSQMVQDEKALGYWKQIVDLGREKAGAYFDIAERALRGEQEAPSGSTDQVLKIKAVEVTEKPSQEDGQTVSLRVVVEGNPAMRPSGMEMAMLVYFYDLVDEKKIDSSTADTMEKFLTEPYDWQDGGTEEIEVIYHQPIFSDEQKRELGERKYHGYVIELYYRDRLQDTVAMPEVLYQMRTEETQASPGTGSIGPENGLFPQNPGQ